MNSIAELLSSVHCGRCGTALVSSFEDNGVIKYKCNCSLKIRTLLNCAKCQKQFLNFPYLIRKTNYCSLRCYRLATYKKKKKICQVCHKKFLIKSYLFIQGFGFYCSRTCWLSLLEQRRTQIICTQCHKKFTVVRAVLKTNPKFCSKKCKDDSKRVYVIRTCKECKREFSLPQWEIDKGKGTFCSRQCFQKNHGETSIERLVRIELHRLHEPFQQELKIGKYYADFYLPDRKLIIECDGEYWHSSEQAKQKDKRKDTCLNQQGYNVVRIKEAAIRESVTSILFTLLQ